MKKNLLIFVLCFIGTANAGLITDENFEGGATGWSDNSTNSAGQFTEFLGRFGGTNGLASLTKNYTLSGLQTQVTIEFDFYELDSWDYELFNFYIDGSMMFSDEFKHNREDFTSGPPINAASLLFVGDNGNQSFGFASWPDQAFHYSLTFNTVSTNLLLGFGTTLNQGINDESWGIDNVRITDNAIPPSAIPEPATLALIGLALAGLGFARKKQH